MRIRAFARTHPGNVRSNNEDSFLLGDTVVSASDGSRVRREFDLSHPLVFAVADGVGGGPGGKVASDLVVEHLSKARPQSEAEIVEVLNDANSALYARMKVAPDLVGMGSTVAGIALAPEGAIAFSLGDSFVAKISGEYVRPLGSPYAGPGSSHVLTVAVGCAPEQRRLVPEIRMSASIPGTYVIASDGVTGQLSSQQFGDLLNSTDGIEKIADRIVDRILESRAPDNITLLLIEVESHE